MKISFWFIIFMLAIGAATTVGLWAWGVHSNYAYSGSLLGAAWSYFKNKNSDSGLGWLWVRSLAYGFGPVLIALVILTELSGHGGKNERLRGARLVSSRLLDTRTRLKSRNICQTKQVEIGGIAIPHECESGHFLLAGSTGSGKSVAVTELVYNVLGREDRAIIVDPDGELYSKFGKDNDVLLNPFDCRSKSWCLFNEIRKHYDYDMLSKSMIPDAAEAAAQQWHGYAQRLLSEVMKEQALRGELDDQKLIYWCTQAPAEKLRDHLAGSALSGMFDGDAAKALASTRFIISVQLSPLQHMRGGDFSLRTWLDEGRGNLYISWRQDMLSTLLPIINAWVDILISHILTLPAESPRPTWLFLDELANLGKLNSIVQGLTMGRKHGLRVVGCLQSTAQLDLVYGQSAATTLRSCFKNLLVLGCSNADPQTAEVMSNGLGQAEIERVVVSRTESLGPVTRSTTRQRETQNIVLSSELMQLAPLSGYLALAGDYPIAKIQLKYVEHQVRNPAFVERA